MEIFKRLYLAMFLIEICKVRPILKSENFKFSEYLKIWSENNIEFSTYFSKLYFANCAKLRPAANTKTSPIDFWDP
jgi:hypothetical protein